MFFEPQFYESQAALFLQQQGYTIARNIRLPLVGLRRAEYPEIDALIYSDRYREPTMVEIKSYPLAETHLSAIFHKYSRLSPYPVTIIAPDFPTTSPTFQSGLIQPVIFTPDLNLITEYYSEAFPGNVPDKIKETMSCGLHHFRYLMPKRAPQRLKRFINQIDKRIRSVESLQHEIITRLPCAPTRVFWSPAQFRNPKWIYSGEGGPLTPLISVADLDGNKMHDGITPCAYGIDGRCKSCYRVAFHAANFISHDLLRCGWTASPVVDSGRRGYHLYLGPESRDYLLRGTTRWRYLTLGIRIDQGSLLSTKGIVGFPGSLHGYTMKPLTEVKAPYFDPVESLSYLPYRRT